MKKWLVSLFSVFVLCILVAVPVLADGENSSSGVKIDGVKYALDKTADGKGWSYDGKGTLTLDGYRGGSIGFYPDFTVDDSQVLYIELKGSNTAESVFLGDTYYNYWRINFTGTGSLDVSGSIPSYMDMSGGTLTTTDGAAEMTIRKGAAVNYSTETTTYLLGYGKITIYGGTLNCHTTGDFGEWNYDDDERISIYNGGCINVTTSAQKKDYGWGNAGLRVYIPTGFMDKYAVTDFSGQTAVYYNPYGRDKALIALASAPDEPIQQIRITGNQQVTVPAVASPVSVKTTSDEKPALAKGTSLTYAKGVYKVTKSDTVNGTVAYTKQSVSGNSVSIPASITVDGIKYEVTSVVANAFKNNKKITKVSIGANVTDIGSNAFSGCTKLASVTGGSNVTSVGKNAFYGCAKLTQVGSTKNAVTLSKVKTIGDNAFYGCKKIKKVNITSTALTKIGASAFRGCTAMTSFTAKSANLASIGKNAFYGDKNLATVTLKTTKLTKSNVKTNAFKGIKSTCKFKVPSSKVKLYKTVFTARGAGKKIKVTK